MKSISNTTLGFMVVVAAIFDAASVVPILNFASNLFAQGIFFIWFKVEGVSYTSDPKIFVTVAASMFLEFIPFLSALPAITFMVARTGLLSRVKQRVSP